MLIVKPYGDPCGKLAKQYKYRCIISKTDFLSVFNSDPIKYRRLNNVDFYKFSIVWRVAEYYKIVRVYIDAKDGATIKAGDVIGESNAKKSDQRAPFVLIVRAKTYRRFIFYSYSALMQAITSVAIWLVSRLYTDIDRLDLDPDAFADKRNAEDIAERIDYLIYRITRDATF